MRFSRAKVIEKEPCIRESDREDTELRESNNGLMIVHKAELERLKRVRKGVPELRSEKKQLTKTMPNMAITQSLSSQKTEKKDQASDSMMRTNLNTIQKTPSETFLRKVRLKPRSQSRRDEKSQQSQPSVEDAYQMSQPPSMVRMM